MQGTAGKPTAEARADDTSDRLIAARRKRNGKLVACCREIAIERGAVDTVGASALRALDRTRDAATADLRRARARTAAVQPVLGAERVHLGAALRGPSA